MNVFIFVFVSRVGSVMLRCVVMVVVGRVMVVVMRRRLQSWDGFFVGRDALDIDFFRVMVVMVVVLVYSWRRDPRVMLDGFGHVGRR